MEQLTDNELVKRYLKGDEQSLDLLVARHLKHVYNFTYGLTGSQQEAEDLTQETFVKVWRNLKKFDRKKNFKTWMFSIARHAAIDFLRKKKTIPFSAFENERGENILDETLASSLPLPDEQAQTASLKETLLYGIEKLSDAYRTILTLYYQDQLNFREIANVLNEPLDTVKSRHRRALMQLRKMFNEE